MVNGKEVKPVLAMYGFRGKQAYIYKTNKIKEVAGASKIIENGFEILYDLAENLGYKLEGRKKEEVKEFNINQLFIEDDDRDGVEVYQGGGNLFILYRNKEIALTINKKFTKELIESTYSLKASCAFIELTKKQENVDIGEAWRKRDFKEDRCKLIEKYERIENQELPMEPYSTLPFVQIDARTSQPLEFTIKIEDKQEKLSRESWLKIQKYNNTNQNSKDNPFEDYSNLLDEYITKKGEESLLAIIYIDGNNMGNKVNQCLKNIPKGNNYDCCVKALRAFSSEIHNVYIEKGLQRVKEKLDELLKTNDKLREPLGYRKIIAAGDEITIICNARIAFEITKAYLEGLPDNYSSCAGISIFHSHDPYSNAYKIAEECCESAKEISHKYVDMECCVLDFHFCHAGIDTSLREIRKKDEIAISRPWLVKKKETGNGDSAVIDIIDLDKVKKMKNQLSKMARSNRMALTEAAVRGRAEFAHELERVLANTDVEEEINLDGLDLEEEKKIQLIYDIGLVYDLWFDKGEMTNE